MKSVIIAFGLSAMASPLVSPNVDRVFVCGTCKKVFEKCATCGVSAGHHGMVDHDPSCTCGGKADFK